MNLSYLKKKVQFTFLKILKTSSTVQVKVRLGRFQLNGGINHRDIVPQTKEVVLHSVEIWRTASPLQFFFPYSNFFCFVPVSKLNKYQTELFRDPKNRKEIL